MILFGADDSFENAIDRLEVRRVGSEVDRDFLSRCGSEFTLGSQVVFDVTGTLDGARVGCAFEFAENLTVGLSRDVGEHVEATAVGHADVDLVEFVIGSVLDDLVEQGDDRFATLERETLLSDELGL